jgi:hypothetical protein
MVISRRTWLLGHAVLHALAVVTAVALVVTYPRRISAPGGYYLVAVRDAGAKVPFERPELAVVTVVDGLGAEDAKHTRAVRWFRAHGRCFLTDVGSPSMSRPLYAVISSGVEQDRTGIRGNDVREPAAMRSVWEEARDVGWPVRGISSTTWWPQLFPRGFDEFLTPPGASDFFDVVRPGALNLVHVLYVDDAGHEQGAASFEYAQAVSRVDRELLHLIDVTDLRTSLLVLTADHGHSLGGGHGGPEPRVATVMTCFAGKNVQPEAALGRLRSTAIAPAVALLTGVPFPRHMRAVDDDLDTVLALVRADPETRAYLEDRAQAVETFRARNRERLAVATGGAGSWTEFYRQRRETQRTLWLLTLAVSAVILFSTSRRPYLFWGPLTVAATVGAFLVLRGSFGLTAMNLKASYFVQASCICLSIGVTSTLLFGWLRGSREDALRLQVPIVVILFGATLGHVVVYGLTLGFPLPPPRLLFLPYFSTVALAAQGAVGLFTCAFVAADPARNAVAPRLETIPKSEADNKKQ